MFRHREHKILLSRKRVNQGMKRMNSLPLSPVFFLYYPTLQGKPLPTNPAEHCSAKLVPRPFHALYFLFLLFFITVDRGGNPTGAKFSLVSGDSQISFTRVVTQGDLVYRQYCLLPAP